MGGVMRGNIYFVRMPRQQIKEHSCEIGRRPVVVVSSNPGNRTSRVVMVCPITTKIKNISCNVNINWSTITVPMQVLCNQITTIPIEALGELVGILTETDMRNVNIGILKSLGIKLNYEEVK